jgi:hypothetical protein
MTITINFSKEEIDQCMKFAEEVVNETFDRFKQNKKTRTERIFFGKLGELIFLNYLKSIGLSPKVEDMFKVFPGIINADKFDFVTKSGKKIDIKTAYEKYHKRILVPYDQFENEKAKDYYVGIKVNLNEFSAKIMGFCDKEKLEQNKKIDFGEGLAYWEYLDNLKAIGELINLL